MCAKGTNKSRRQSPGPSGDRGHGRDRGLRVSCLTGSGASVRRREGSRESESEGGGKLWGGGKVSR